MLVREMVRRTALFRVAHTQDITTTLIKNRRNIGDKPTSCASLFDIIVSFLSSNVHYQDGNWLGGHLRDV